MAVGCLVAWVPQPASSKTTADSTVLKMSFIDEPFKDEARAMMGIPTDPSVIKKSVFAGAFFCPGVGSVGPNSSIFLRNEHTKGVRRRDRTTRTESYDAIVIRSPHSKGL